MINVLRKNQKALMIVIAVLCIPFIFYFQSDTVGVGGKHFGQIYDRPVSIVEFQHNARLFNLARELGMFSFMQDMVTGAQSEDQVYSEFTWNRLVLRHEAERLGIKPAPHEIGSVVRDLRPFRGQTGFDMNKYNEFTQNVLPAMGFTEDHIEELAADQLMLTKMKDLLGTGVQISESESQQNYERSYGKLNVAVARLNTDELGKGVTVGEEDITKYYEANKAQLNTEEKRKVNFVSFGLDEEQKKLTGKERVEVLQKLADQASEFNQALLEKGADFQQLATKFQLPVKVTEDFTRTAPDPQLAANPQLAEAAFALKPDASNSDAIQAGDGFYVLHLANVEPARPLTLEEARPTIAATLKEQRVRELAAAQGAEAAQKIRDAVKGGAPAEAAIQQAGLTPEKLPPFALADPPAMRMQPGQQQPEPESPDLQMIKSSLVELNPGEVTDFIPTATGGAVAVLAGREQPDAGTYEQTRTSFNARVLNSRKQVAFAEWLKERRREAGVQTQAEPEAPANAG